jgi:hypothetical protein
MGLALAWLIWAPIGIVVNGWLLSLLWLWFAVPLGAPRIGIAHAIGVSLLVRVITYDPDLTDKGENPIKVFVTTVLMFIVLRAMALLVAAIAHAAMG